MNSLFQQLRQLWSQLGLNQRVTVAVAGAAVLAGMVGLVAWSQRPQMQLLYGRLSTKEIASVVSSVQELGVRHELGANGTAVYVPADQVHKIRLALASKGIPSGEGVGFEIFDRANFGVSDFIQRTNYSRALQGELSRTISQLQGVRSARVLVVMPENRLLFTDTRSKPTASVFVEGSINQEQVNSIRFLVANSVEGLKTEDVAVVDNRGQVLTEGLKDDPSLGAASAQMRLRRSVEDYFANKVETMLAKVLGPQKAVVRVSAELDSEATTRTEEKFDPEGQVVKTETTTDDTTTTNESEAGAQPVGSTANLAGAADAGKPNQKTSNTEKKNKTTSFEINKTVMNSVKAPGSVSRLTAAVVVAPEPGSTPEKSDARKNMLRSMVANALGVKGTDAELKKIVSIEEMDFIPIAPEATGVIETLTKHADVLKDAGAVLVALMLFGAFVRMLRRTKPDEIPMEALYSGGDELVQSEGRSAAGGAGGSVGAAASSGAGAKNASGVTVELINEMIRRKPQNVGVALRNWVDEENKGADS
jgi:flagellar M-ring protein FliF